MIGAPGDNDNLSYTLMGSDFTDTISQTGTIGDDVMQGTPTGEHFLGDLGNDQIETEGGIDVVYAGPGQDLVTVRDTYFRRLDGGPGIDALLFEGYNGQPWDLTTLSPGSRLRNFEILVTSDYGANTLTLNSATIMQMTSGNTLSLQMDAEDTLVLSPDFNYAGKKYGGNQYYDLYTSSSSAAQVLLNRITNSSDTNVIRVLKTAPASNAPKPIYESESLAQTSKTMGVAATNEPVNTETVNNEIANDTVQDMVAMSAGLPLNNLNTATSLSVTNPRANEADGAANFTIQRSGDLQKYVWVNYSTQDGNAVAGKSYCPTSGQLLFSPGETQKSVSVPLINDKKYIGDHEFGLLVSIVDEYKEPRGERPVEFQLLADAHGEELRRWSNSAGKTRSGVENNVLEFDVTTTKGRAQVDLGIAGAEGINAFYMINSSTGKYEDVLYNGSIGAKFVTPPLKNTSGAQLFFEDGQLGDADGIVNGLVQLQGYPGRVNPGPTNNGKTFWAPTSADGRTQFRLVDAPAEAYEFGWLKVDGAGGQLQNGTATVMPGDTQYEALLAARLADKTQKVVLFQGEAGSSRQALTPALADKSFSNPGDLLASEGKFFGHLMDSQMNANEYMILYSVVQGKARFSSLEAPTVTNQGRGYSQVSFAGITAEIGGQAIVIPGQSNTVVSMNVALSRAADYTSTMALYQVDDLTGGLDTNGDRTIDILPSDKGYAHAALNRARDPLSGVILQTPKNFSSLEQRVDLKGSGMYGVLMLPNTSIDDVLRLNPDNQPIQGLVAFSSFEAANPDGIAHASRLGHLLYGFEDQLFSGDSDYNDMILKISPVV